MCGPSLGKSGKTARFQMQTQTHRNETSQLSPSLRKDAFKFIEDEVSENIMNVLIIVHSIKLQTQR